jgi:KDO2-lipid IV(A) lauroyltransferase
LVPSGLDAPLKLAQALERGLHVGMLADQYNVQGVDVMFFGRRTRANPLIARLARHFDCPIHGVRVIRLPGRRFTGEITEAIAPVRDAEGGVDVAATMQVITAVIEGWVREHPEQWLWLHRRWR